MGEFKVSMLENKTLLASPLLGLTVIFFLLLVGKAEATPTAGDCAIIIVSSYDPDPVEKEKAQRYYDYLIDQDVSPSNIVYLSYDTNDPGVDGYSSTSVIQDAFEEVGSLSDLSNNVFIYISDHVPPPLSNSSVFLFDDGDISFTEMDGLIDLIEADETTIYIGGNHSGRVGPILSSFGRTIICSMGSNQSFVPDGFDLERSLSDSSADLNNDRKVSHIEAYWKERGILYATGQEPELYA